MPSPSCLTLGHGRHLGLVRGGRSRRIRPLLQPGNLIRVTWRARLSDHLGGFNVELIEAHAARVLDDAAALAAIGTIAGLARLLPERDPHPELYAATLVVMRAFDDAKVWPARSCAGSFSFCRSSASASILANAPRLASTPIWLMCRRRSGRAVSRDAGQPYCDRLLKLPAFLLDDTAPANDADIAAGLALTGHFLMRDVLEPHGLTMPQARDRLIGLLGRMPKAALSA